MFLHHISLTTSLGINANSLTTRFVARFFRRRTDTPGQRPRNKCLHRGRGTGARAEPTLGKVLAVNTCLVIGAGFIISRKIDALGVLIFVTSQQIVISITCCACIGHERPCWTWTGSSCSSLCLGGGLQCGGGGGRRRGLCGRLTIGHTCVVLWSAPVIPKSFTYAETCTLREDPFSSNKFQPLKRVLTHLFEGQGFNEARSDQLAGLRVPGTKGPHFAS